MIFAKIFSFSDGLYSWLMVHIKNQSFCFYQSTVTTYRFWEISFGGNAEPADNRIWSQNKTTDTKRSGG